MADDDPTNDERAATALAALKSQEKYHDDWPAGFGESIADLVTDLLHLARLNGVEPDYVIHTSQMNFDAEVQEETGIDEDLAHEDTDNVFTVGPPANGKETQL